MFTGIIEEIGTIKEIKSQGSARRFQIRAATILDDLVVDQSVSVNGVCLTVVEIGNSFFSADAVAETLAKSTLSQLRRKDKVNLERAMRLQDRLGGHLVQGHVDGVGAIRQLTHQSQASKLTVAIPEELERYTIQKGSIAFDGVSLTIANKEQNLITVAIIPHTMKQTVFQFKESGDLVNIEVDFLAKYVENFVLKAGETKITSEWLKQQGF
ncbi:MAG: riboflavin synthase [bacterium]|nr:MAG: riboflavin synthase [bacterium]